MSTHVHAKHFLSLAGPHGVAENAATSTMPSHLADPAARPADDEYIEYSIQDRASGAVTLISVSRGLPFSDVSLEYAKFANAKLDDLRFFYYDQNGDLMEIPAGFTSNVSVICLSEETKFFVDNTTYLVSLAAG